MLERLQVAVDRVGEPALLAHLLHQPRGEPAAADELVEHEGRQEVGILARHGRKPEHRDRLRDVHRDPFLGALARLCQGNGQDLGLLRQLAEHVVEQLAELFRRDIADGNHLEIAAREDPLAIGLEILARDRLHGLGRALGGPRVGMAGKRHREPLLGRHLLGIAIRVDEVGEQLAADAFDRIRVEARLGERQLEQLRRFCAVLRQRLEVAVEGIARILEAHAHRQAFHLLLEVARRDVACAFVEHRRKVVCHPVLTRRILRVSALERELERKQRVFVRFDEPRLESAGAGDFFDFHGVSGPGKGETESEHQKGERHCRADARERTAKHIHWVIPDECFRKSVQRCSVRSTSEHDLYERLFGAGCSAWASPSEGVR